MESMARAGLARSPTHRAGCRGSPLARADTRLKRRYPISIESTPSDWLPIGRRRSALPPGIRICTGTRARLSGCTAGTGRTRKWTDGRSTASMKPSWMWDSLPMIDSDRSYTTTSSGQPRPRCPATTNPKRTYRMDSESPAGRGTDSFVEPVLTRAELVSHAR
jgi:hypothetical protein